MIRKLLLFSMLSLIALTANSQVLITLLLGDKLNQPGLEFGLDGGFNYSGNSGFESNSSYNSFNLGFYFDITLKDQLSLYTGVLVKSELGNGDLKANDLTFLGSPTYPEEGTYNQSISYFNVPILLKYSFENHIYVEAGPQTGLMYNAHVIFKHSSNEREVINKDFNKDQFKRLDAGATFGLGYRLRKGTGMTLGLKYYQGFVNVMKGQGNSKNHSLYLKANIPIGGKENSSKPK